MRSNFRHIRKIMKLFLRSQIHEKEKEKEVVTVGNSAQDGVNMAVANKDEGINYGQYLQVGQLRIFFRQKNSSNFLPIFCIL